MHRFGIIGKITGWMAGAAILCAVAVPGLAGQSGNTVGQSASGKKFLYLDDGTSPQAESSTPARREPLPPLFLERTTASPLDSLAERHATSRFVIELDALKPAVPGIRPTVAALGAQSRTSFQIGYPLSAGEREFGVWLTTEAARQAVGFQGRWQSVPLMSFDQQSYNVGLNVGYSGFTLGAALSREAYGFDGGMQGFDLGIGYHGQRWFTNVQVGEYRSDRNPLFFGFFGERDRHVFQLGAGYSFWPNLSLSGRFRYYDYSNPFFPELGGLSQEHVFTLDTKLNF